MKTLLKNATKFGTSLAVSLVVLVGGVGVSMLHAFTTLA